jgi:hypothetical protein
VKEDDDMNASRTMVVLGFLGFLGAGLAACGGEDKSGCRTTADCLSGRQCNFDREAQIGRCMEATTDGFFMCSRQNPCPAGQFCFNGLCAPGCMADQDCAANQYCDTLMQVSAHMCVNREVPTCSANADCASNQTCVMGLCSAQSEPKECTQRPDGQDGCDAYSICLDVGEGEQEENACVSFPPCPADGACPVGQIGSVCNDGDIPGKARICLTSLCKSGANCPAAFQCLMFGGGTLGMCSDGSFGMPCLQATDCAQGLTCLGAMAGVPGFCMPGGTPGCTSAGGTCVDMMSGGDCPAGTSVDTSKSCSGMTEMCCI